MAKPKISYEVTFSGPVMGTTLDTISDALNYAARFPLEGPEIWVRIPLELWQKARFPAPMFECTREGGCRCPSGYGNGCEFYKVARHGN